MKANKLFACCAVGALALSACSNMTSDEKAPESITKDDVNNISYLVGYSFGQYIDGNDFGALNFKQIEKGIKDAIAGTEINEEDFYQQMNDYMEKRNAANLEANKAEAEKFFEKNKAEKDVVTLESGVQYKVVRPGNGVKPGPEDEVEVNYEGKLLDGTVFDSSYERNEPATFALNQVIKGWGEGLQYCEEGGEILLWIPSDQAYGDQGAGGKIGPGAALQFRVELNKVTPVGTPEEAAK